MTTRRRSKLSRHPCPRRRSWMTPATLLLLLLTVTPVTSTTGDELDTGRGTALNSKPQTSPRSGFSDLDSPYRDAGYYKVDFAGDVIFGGLFPMHEKGVERSCGEIKKEKGIQRLEAMLYAVDRINEDETLLPGLKVGVRILDTCSYDTFALERCMDFIKAQLSSIDMQDYRCADDHSPAYHRQKPVAGVIGAASSTVSIMVANILRLFKCGLPLRQTRDRWRLDSGHYRRRPLSSAPRTLVRVAVRLSVPRVLGSV